MSERKRTSKKWLKIFGIKRGWIYDPDGWDRKNFDYSFNKERITAVEFESRLCQSTIVLSRTEFPLRQRRWWERWRSK